MKFLNSAKLILLLSINSMAAADTVEARCDIYPAGEDKASGTMACTFSQRQGYIYIDRKDGVSYELSPVGDHPGNFVDQDGNAAYRNSGLGKRGQIYRMKKESVFIYWDPYPFNQ